MKSFKNEDARYVYYAWDEEAKAEVPHYLVPGENEVSDELIVTLKHWDHREELDARYDQEHADYKYQNYSKKAERGEGVNPMDELSHDRWQAGLQDDYSARVDLVRELMGSLTEAQVDLVYEIFGERHSQKEIADRTGKTPQSVNNRVNKVKARMKKLLEERDFTL